MGPFAVQQMDENSQNMRLDRWIMKHVCSNWNATQKLISAKQVWVLHPERTEDQHRRSVMIPRFRPEVAGSKRLQPGDYVYFPRTMAPRPKRRYPTKQGSEPPGWLLRRVLYKDTDFLAIDKPAGWAVLPGRHVGGMHLHRLFPTLQFGNEEPPRLVHRLSTELSGVLLLARHKAAAAYAKDLIQQRAFWQRSFWGLVCGRTPSSGTVSMPLAQERCQDRMISKPRREDDGGFAAITEYQLQRFSPLAGGLSLLELNPYSGRHHQTRAHCAFGLRAPLVGDPVYYSLSNSLNTETDFRVRYHSEDAKKERKELLGPQPSLHLHSRQLHIKTFAGRDVVITARLPPPMLTSFEKLGWGNFARRADREAAKLLAWSPDQDQQLQEALRRADHNGEDAEAEETVEDAAEETGDDQVLSFELPEIEEEGPPIVTRGRRSRRTSR